MQRKRRRLAELRKAAGHTQLSLAKAVGVDVSTVHRWESGESDPQPWRRGPLAVELRITIDELDRVLTQSGAAPDTGDHTSYSAVGGPALHPFVDECSVSEHKGVLDMAEQRARAFSRAFGTSGLSSETLEQVYDDVANLAVDYQRRPITEVLGQLSSTQEAVFSLLEQRQRPSQARDLFFFGGVVSGVLAKACHDFSNSSGALVHARTAYLCADQADHDGLRAWTRGLQSQICYWAGRPHDALRYAQSGADFAARNTGSMSVWLPSSEARAWAVLGNAEETLAAIHRAETAIASTGSDELDALGGLCTFGGSRQQYYAADALAWLPDQAATAERYATSAVQAYQDANSPGWAFGDQAGSHANLTIARASKGEREGAAAALRPVLDLPPELRINGVVSSARRVHEALRRSSIASATTDMQQEIEEFSRTPLPALPPGSV